MENFAVFWEALVPIYCLYYGIKMKKSPPKFGEKGGLGTKLSMHSREAWEFANAYGGKLCLIFGAVTAVLFILRLVMFGMSINLTYSIILIIIEMICLCSLVPLINYKVRKTFNIKK